METNYLHSGSSGDVIYALPAIEALSKKSSTKANLFLEPDVHASYYQGAYHPNGTSRLTANGIKFLLPLLNSLDYINKADFHTTEKIDVYMDHFRNMKTLNLANGHIARWYFYFLAVNRDLSKPWLFVNSEKHGAIVINRTFRYRNNMVNYSFLNELPYDIVFTGLEEEFIVCRKEIPKLTWVKTQSALEMTKIINGARLFIGNQSFAFALAEGLKITRVLEVCPWTPNVIPHGEEGWDFYTQEMFETIVLNILGS